MAKTLLTTASESDNTDTFPLLDIANEHQVLSELTQALRPHLEHAAADLLQPRQQVIDALLTKVLD